MSNRELLDAILQRYRGGTQAQKDFVAECEHQMSVETEDGPAHQDVVSAFDDAYNFLECSEDRAGVKAAREALIEAGYYRVMTTQEIADTVTTRGTAWSFRLKGKPYIYDKSFDKWLEAP